MTPTRFAILLSVVLAGCTTKDQSSYLEILRVIPGTFAAPVPPATQGTCSISPTDKEVDFLNIDLTKRFGLVGVVVSNNLTSNAVTGINRLNTNNFIAKQAVISYEVIGGGSGPGQVISPAQGLAPSGATSALTTFLFPQGANVSATIPAGKSVRVSFRIEGKLEDGSSARTNQFDYVFQTCAPTGAADCSSSQCL